MKIACLMLDIDGVLTDGSIFITANGEETKKFHVQDGLGLARLVKLGMPIAVISGRQSPAAQHYLSHLGIEHIYLGQADKCRIFEQLLAQWSLDASQIAYVGDDLPDLPIMTQVGMPISVPNAVPEVKKIAHWITHQPGGHGAVREITDYLCQQILEAQACHTN